MRLTTNALFFTAPLTAAWTICALVCSVALAQDGSSTLDLQAERTYVPRHWSADWRGSFGGTNYAEGRDEGAAAFMHFGVRVNYTLLNWLNIMIEPQADIYSSRLQERYDHDAYENKLRANNLYIRAHLDPGVEARAGALSQEVIHNELLISRHRAFPGLQERAAFKVGDVNLEFVAQQLVPTSYTLNTEREGKEPLPSFQTQTLDANYHPRFALLSAQVGHFTWAQLPDKVAFESSIIGNSTNNSETAPGSRFSYRFDGFFWDGNACFCEQPLGVDIGYSGERNMLAPQAYGEAQEWHLGPVYRRGAREMHLTYRKFFIASDATVADYLPATAFGTNRMGQGLQVKYALKDHGWSVRADWVNGRAIVDNDHQFTFTEYWLSVETEYAPF